MNKASGPTPPLGHLLGSALCGSGLRGVSRVVLGAVVPQPPNSLPKCLSGIGLGHPEHQAQPGIGAEIRTVDLVWVVGFVPSDKDRLPGPVEQPADLTDQAGVRPS